MSKETPDFHCEEALWAQGYRTVCGLDEAGAGPLAGPVYAAAVILRPDAVPQGLNDSKKLSEKQREKLFAEICEQAVAYAVASVSAEEIDRLNILNARMLAMERARSALSVPCDFALIDGNCNRGIAEPNQMVVGGDAVSLSIAAASILAKVSRDRYMVQELDALYPQYGFAKHKGYGTKLHYQMLDTYGACPAHRVSFLKKWEAKR